MTNEDLMLHIKALRISERNAIEELRQRYRIDQQRFLNDWANEHARFRVGDIITSNTILIRVESIMGVLGLRDVPFVRYNGHALTKQLKNRADGLVSSIYDDSPERNIIKIK